MFHLITSPQVELSFYSDKVSEIEYSKIFKDALIKYKGELEINTLSDTTIIKHLFNEDSIHILKHLEPFIYDNWLKSISRVMCLISSEKDVTRTENQAQDLLNLFKFLCNITDPKYATITTEYTLETPYELCKDDRSYAFKDFYISSSYLKADFIEKILELARKENIFFKEIQSGFLFLTGSQFICKELQCSNVKSEKLSFLVINCIKRMECHEFHPLS